MAENSRLTRLKTRKALVAEVVVVWSVIRGVIDYVSSFDTIEGHMNQMIQIWHFLASPAGNLVTFAFGLGWLSFIVFKEPERKSHDSVPNELADSQISAVATVPVPVTPFNPVPLNQRAIFERSDDPRNADSSKWLRAVEQQWKECGIAIQEFARLWKQYLRDLEVFRGRIGLQVDIERGVVRAREVFATELIALLELFDHKVEPEIAILNVSDNDEVAREHIVRGIARPQGTPALHVRVRTGDGRWWRQDAPTWDGMLWSVTCRFGTEHGPIGGTYKIIAILGDAPSAEIATEAEIQSEYVVRSNVVSVRRTKG
jgi:hypothetical protein